MTVLASAEEIDKLNIDTVERAIAYSAFLLRAAIVGVNREQICSRGERFILTAAHSQSFYQYGTVVIPVTT
jgi:hypothetical protein